MSNDTRAIDQYQTFGELLRYLRTCARLTQLEFAMAVGYSESQISRLESNHRLPDVDVVTGLFIPVLQNGVDETAKARLIELAKQARTYAAVLPSEPGQPSNNLPVPLNSFVGREKEVAEGLYLLSASPPISLAGKRPLEIPVQPAGRLLTFTGAGGCGKTRLALEICYKLLDQYRGGIWVVWLAGLQDPQKMPGLVANTLGLQPRSDLHMLELLTNHLRNRRTLLMLDNCEHLLDACARLVEHLLQSCPSLEIIATTREPLRIEGEIVYRVPSLTVPDRRLADLAPEDIIAYEAVQLFADRAALALPGFQITPQMVRAVVDICARLDGIPLAIELAAARVASLRVEVIAAHLDNRFHLLTGGSRTALPRQQTLRASVDWSYNLLNAAEQSLFRRLSVFADGWTEDAAETICSGDGIETGQVLELLVSLVSKSLVVFREKEGRYYLLETIRQYARELLVHEISAGEAEEKIRYLHLVYFMQKAEQAEKEYHSLRYRYWSDWLEMEKNNIRAALDWGLACEDPSGARLGLRLISAISWIYYTFNGQEIVTWLDRYLALRDQPDFLPPALVAKGLGSKATVMRLLPGASAAAILQNMNEAIALYTQEGDIEGRTMVLIGKAFLASIMGRYSEGLQAVHESETLVHRPGFYEKYGSDWLWAKAWAYMGSDQETSIACLKESIALAQKNDEIDWHLRSAVLGDLFSRAGDFEQAEGYLQKALALGFEINSSGTILMCLLYLGEHAYRTGRFSEMEMYFQEVLRTDERSGNFQGSTWPAHAYGIALRRQGRPLQAAEYFHKRMEYLLASGKANEAKHVMGSLGGVAIDLGRWLEGARLLGASEGDLSKMRYADILEAERRRDRSEARSRMGDEAFENAYHAGQALALEDAIALARSV